ncbi:hypothetical protein [Desulfosporosinus nitroreducens]|uniref:Sporulation protein YjcZ n=1 Tax=Desulfosporosinus nitroreducens TaxID=2018668 RepID=A0ABT8QUS4_9FIRM|nr:hypothetical protein [Desulfosporosinus nitroreducens]MDO0825113.1 hypothetical protein [Desulfosporosinus nitroreducens]
MNKFGRCHFPHISPVGAPPHIGPVGCWCPPVTTGVGVGIGVAIIFIAILILIALGVIF